MRMVMQSWRKLHMHTRMQKLMNWDIPVARAAPAVPMPRVKMKMGSNPMLISPPAVIPNMAKKAFPWKRSRLFMMKEQIIKGAARRI